MAANTPASWGDYWQQFDRLIELLAADGREEIIAELRYAQGYVNGMTDGWFDYMIALEDVIKDHKGDLTAGQAALAAYLLSAIKTVLLSR